MKCQYRNDGNEAEYEVIRDVVPDGVLGSGMPHWEGFVCKECLDKLKSIKRHLPKSIIVVRPRHTREDFHEF